MSIIKVRDNENNRRKRNAKNIQKTKTEKNKKDGSYSERVKAKRFCCAFTM